MPAEGWAEYAERDPEAVREQYKAAPVKYASRSRRQILRTPPARKSTDRKASLELKRGRLARYRGLEHRLAGFAA